MLLYVLKLNQNAKMPEAYGKYYAYPVITQTVGIDGLAEHMASHNTPFSKGAIKGMITDMVSCIKELTLQGFAVKIDDLAIFSIGIRNKEGSASEKEFTIAKNSISPLQRPHYFTSSYTYLFSKKVILLSFLGWRIA